MRGTNRRSRYNLPLSIVPQPGKVGQDFREAAGTESSDILHEDVAGSSLANKTGCVGPEPTLVFRSLAPACEAGGLAGESGGDDVADPGEEVHGADVFFAGDDRPPSREYGPAIGVDLAKRDVPKPSCAFESKCDPSDPLEKADDSELGNRVT
jgi:hypothetical protein